METSELALTTPHYKAVGKSPTRPTTTLSESQDIMVYRQWDRQRKEEYKQAPPPQREHGTSSGSVFWSESNCFVSDC